MQISLKHISKVYEKENYVLKDLNLEMQDKDFTTLLGPSGCGKTTLLRMIAGLAEPSDGEIWFDDTCVFSKEKKIDVAPEKRNVGFVFQDFALWPHMTVFENVAFGLRARKDTDNLNERVTQALKMVRLDNLASRYPAQLSGGQQQRVSFARAIAFRPECILFDEPLSALDAILRDEMRTEIRRITKTLGITSVFVTHDQTEAMSMSDSIVVMNKGIIEQKDTPENIYEKPASTFVAKFVGKSNWIGESRMFRPEAAVSDVVNSGCGDDTAGPAENGNGTAVFEGEAVSSQFMGTDYEVILKYNNARWVVRMPYKAEAGQKVLVKVKDNKIYQFA